MRTSMSQIDRNDYLSRLGFKYGRGGAHTSRTMMIEDLEILLSYVNNPDAEKEEYSRAIIDDNCLGKRSGKTRLLTFRHLVDLYSLEKSVLLFRALLFFWNRDIDSRPLLALLCSYARDPIFRTTADFILGFTEGSVIERESVEEFIDNQESGRFSNATLKSTAQNINSTWTKSGHLDGRAKKTRSRAIPTAGSVSYALLLGYISGTRGQALFQSEYIKILDCSYEKAIELAEKASRQGWIVFKRVGVVIEVLFPGLINPEEQELLNEQN